MSSMSKDKCTYPSSQPAKQTIVQKAQNTISSVHLLAKASGSGSGRDVSWEKDSGFTTPPVPMYLSSSKAFNPPVMSGKPIPYTEVVYTPAKKKATRELLEVKTQELTAAKYGPVMPK